MAFHANVEVQLTNTNENFHALTARCVAAARNGNVPKAEIEAFLAEIWTQGRYDDALATCARWFTVS